MLYIIDKQRLEAQNYVSQRRTQDFWISELGAALEIFLSVKVNTQPRAQSTATPCTLVSRGLANGFNTKLFNFIAPGIAFDTRQPTVYHKADTWDRHRGFGNVCRKNDAPCLTFGMKNSALLGLA